MKKGKKWQGEISATEMPEPFKALADLIGIENTLILAGKMGGSNIYIPKIETLYRGIRDKKIFEEFTGGNYLSLAKKYSITERRIRKIIKDYSKKNTGSRKPNKDKTEVQYQRLFWP